ncbi:hypothetical protein FACS1894191_6550 [Clostridia bacterium]|nr:hypothetical protein FACS1894191_6550 [Clostridia bacterium]
MIQKVVDKVVATKERATITGRISIYASANDAKIFSGKVILDAKNRNSRPPKCRQIHTIQRPH